MSERKDIEKRQDNFYTVCGPCLISCCSSAHPPITHKREKIINDYLEANKIVIANSSPFQRSDYTFPSETEGNRCVFQDKFTKRCRIHNVKPETCVAGPVTFDLDLKTGRIEWFLKTAKICPLAGALSKDKKSLENHLESARRELLRLVNDLDAEALRAILRIEEPDTFKIGEENLHDDVLKKLVA